jgi:hypothetical protein
VVIRIRLARRSLTHPGENRRIGRAIGRDDFEIGIIPAGILRLRSRREVLPSRILADRDIVCQTGNILLHGS